MIYYNPLTGVVSSDSIKYRPHTCFLMTKLGTPLPQEITSIRNSLEKTLHTYNIDLIDANEELTGKDFMVKIWEMILSVPLGIAIITDELPTSTLENIFYEIGLFQSHGKETLVIKTNNSTVPSDFVRTEYIEYDKDFTGKIRKFIKRFYEQAEHYLIMAEQLQNDPLLEIDYLKRAYLITHDEKIKQKIRESLTTHEFDHYIKSIYKQLLRY